MWPAPEDMSVMPLNMGASDEDIREGKARGPLKLQLAVVFCQHKHKFSVGKLQLGTVMQASPEWLQPT